MSRACVFCLDAEARLTVEDVIPTWYLERRKGFAPTVHVVTRFGTTKGYQPRSLKVASKVLCKECNSVRLGQVQDRAAPYLRHMVDGEPTELDVPAQTAVAAWLSMTALTWQWAIGDVDKIPDRIRADFLAAPFPKRPPAGVAVWIGHRANEPGRSTLVNSYYLDTVRTLHLREGSAPLDPNRNPAPFGATICVEHFVGQVAGHSIPGGDIAFDLQAAGRFWETIWPPRRTVIRWPAHDPIDKPTLIALERAFNEPGT
jgi:hypothetical protein